VSCRNAGDSETANHCRNAIKSVATSFEINAVLEALKSADVQGADLLHAAKSWKLN
jgi:hypothetical protein